MTTKIDEYSKHWETVFATKLAHEVSWTQVVPSESLHYIANCNLPTDAVIWDIGCGENGIGRHCAVQGYTDFTGIDIAHEAILKAKANHPAGKYFCNNVLDLEIKQSIDLWHDRACFHFLTNPTDIAQYIAIVNKTVMGYLLLATFSKSGPLKCSGLEIVQYNAAEIEAKFNENFELINTMEVDHVTPFSTVQNFVYCLLKRKK